MEYQTKILIADESAGERQILREGLNRAGWRLIDEAQNGEEALQKLQRTRYDAALLSRIGFKQTEDGRFLMDLNGFFEHPCQH